MNYKKFLFDYEHSTFIECNEKLARKNEHSNYTQNLLKNKKVSKRMNHISNKLEKLFKNYWLADGSLLGKYKSYYSIYLKLFIITNPNYIDSY